MYIFIHVWHVYVEQLSHVKNTNFYLKDKNGLKNITECYFIIFGIFYRILALQWYI